jgi:hypothetical protein
MQRRAVLIGALTVVGAAAWYAFRPERLFIDKTVNESLAAEVPAARARALGTSDMPTAIASGGFHGVHHETRGQATVYRLPNGKRVLRLTDFETSNGPDVQIYLVAATDARDNATVPKAGFVSLGAMKGNRGDQNYDVPDSVDLAKYRAVTVWCRRFAVNFATAPLTDASQMMPAAAAAASTAPASVAHGRFHGNAHETSGAATVFDLGGGRRVLRLTEFATSNGPDVHVYLVAATDVTSDGIVKRAGFVDLGSLKGNRGDQNYEIPAGVDLAKYRTATIWCKRFSVNFGSAPLAAG